MSGKQFGSVPTYNGRAVVLIAKQAEIDAGATPLDEVEVVVSDTDITAASHVFASVSFDTPTGKDADDVPMDTYVVLAYEAAGQVTMRLRSLDGPVHDKYLINYLIA